MILNLTPTEGYCPFWSCKVSVEAGCIENRGCTCCACGAGRRHLLSPLDGCSRSAIYPSDYKLKVVPILMGCGINMTKKTESYRLIHLSMIPSSANANAESLAPSHMLRRLKWEDFKSTVKRWYMDENRALENVKEVLCAEDDSVEKQPLARLELISGRSS